MKLHQSTFEIATASPFEVMTKIRNAGAIFIGENSSEPLGDYFADRITFFRQTELQNFSSFLYDFIKKSSIISYQGST